MKKGSKMGGVLLLAIAATAFLGLAVMLLWNSLMPGILNTSKINFWQAIGLFLLAKILFGGYFNGFTRRHDLRREIHNRWEQMSPEERKAFFERGRFRFSHFERWRNDPGQPDKQQ
jgi:hypothetical protein